MAQRKNRKPLQTKKHLARQEVERRQRNAIMLATIVVLIIVVGLVGYGIINEFVLKPNQTVVKVADDKVSAKEFTAVARFNGQQIVNGYIQNIQFAQMLGYDSSYYETFQQQAEASLEPDALGNQTVNFLIDDLLIRQEAERRNITVTEEEIDLELQKQFNFFPDGTPTPEPTYPAIPTSTLSDLQLQLVPPTATAFAAPEVTSTVVMTSTETAQTTPTTALTSTPTLEPTPELTPTITLTPTPYTRELYETDYAQVVENFESNEISEKTLRWIIESQLYREKVREAVLADLNLTHTQEQVWARHILVEDEETANQVIARLKAGEDFAALAAELSTDTGSGQKGGDLGWFGRGAMVPEFEEAAFSLEIGEISDPVLSSFGYHIIQVLGHEDRYLSQTEFSQLEDQSFQEWLDLQRTSTEIETNDYWRQVVPEITLPTI
jgi:parvulin-like peptidyl-prolyl isomerase